MNNNHFAIVRYLRDMGVDAYLLLTDGERDHFHPSADTFDTTYMQYTKQLTWGSGLNILSTSSDQINHDLSGYDILVGCGYVPAYCQKAGINLDIFVPYGADIWDGTKHKITSPKKQLNDFILKLMQKKGLANCKVWHMAPADKMYEKQYQKFKGNSQRWLEGLPMVYSPIYKKENLEKMINSTHWGHEFLKIRNQTEFMVVSHMRHYWGEKSDPNSKGNDILINGWKQFLTQSKSNSAILILTEYGKDVDKSKALIKKLEIENSVKWMPKMTRKDIMVALLLCDVVCGEFLNSWSSSGVLYEGLVSAKPILAYRNDDDYENLYPILNANTPQVIAQKLIEVIKDKDKSRKVGIESQQWYTDTIQIDAINRYLEYFKNKKIKKYT